MRVYLAPGFGSSMSAGSDPVTGWEPAPFPPFPRAGTSVAVLL